MLRPGDIGKVFFKPGCPTSTLVWDCAPNSTPQPQLGCRMLQELTLLSLPMPPLSSQQLPQPSIHAPTSQFLPHPQFFFSPQGAWTPLSVTTKAHLWLCLLDPCAHLCCCSGNNLWVGCRAVFPCSFQGKQPRPRGKATGHAVGCTHSSCVHPPGDAWGNYSSTGSFRNAIFY